jgi:hypothetical protein
MDLKTFIAKTLVGIHEGVEEAIRQVRETGGAVNPCFGSPRSVGQQYVQLVEFDVAVMATQPAGDTDSVIEVLTAKAGTREKKAKDAQAATRVRFTIPILPAVQVLSEQGFDASSDALRRASKVASSRTAAEATRANSENSDHGSTMDDPIIDRSA